MEKYGQCGREAEAKRVGEGRADRQSVGKLVKNIPSKGDPTIRVDLFI
jgi:hypothetical protein